MVVVAGPVFTEWTGPPAPIFFGLVFGPPVTAAAALLYVAVPRRYRRRVPGGRPVRAASADLLAYIDALEPVPPGRDRLRAVKPSDAGADS